MLVLVENWCNMFRTILLICLTLFLGSCEQITAVVSKECKAYYSEISEINDTLAFDIKEVPPSGYYSPIEELKSEKYDDATWEKIYSKRRLNYSSTHPESIEKFNFRKPIGYLFTPEDKLRIKVVGAQNLAENLRNSDLVSSLNTEIPNISICNNCADIANIDVVVLCGNGLELECSGIKVNDGQWGSDKPMSYDRIIEERVYDFADILYALGPYSKKNYKNLKESIPNFLPSALEGYKSGNLVLFSQFQYQKGRIEFSETHFGSFAVVYGNNIKDLRATCFIRYNNSDFLNVATAKACLLRAIYPQAPINTLLGTAVDFRNKFEENLVSKMMETPRFAKSKLRCLTEI